MTKILELLLIPFLLIAIAFWLLEDWINGRPLGSMD